MKMINFKQLSFVTFVLLLLAGFVNAQKQKPNVLLIYVDDLDFDELNTYEYQKLPCYTTAWKSGVYQPPAADAYFQQAHWHRKGERPYFENSRQYTPNIDKLAKEGMMFNRFYVTTTICTPSRYSLLTGNYASKSSALPSAEKGSVKNIRWNTPITPADETLIKKLNKCGYTTALFGKWHNHFYGPEATKPYTWETIYQGMEVSD